MKKQVLIVTGPTGIGKTDLVLRLADKMPAEIINADIGQMYQPLSIGTAKPDWQNEPVLHHLFDILDEPKDFTVVRFRKKVLEQINQIWDKGKTPIIVGGSTLYIKSLFFPPLSKDKLDRKVDSEVDSVSGELWDKLNKIDPVRAAKIHPNDNYRLERALDIWNQTGTLPSKYVPQFDPVAQNMTLVIIDADKPKLYQRIDDRVDIMMDMGWVNEVQRLSVDWHDFLRRKKLIGYEVILDYLDKKIDFATCIATIQKRVRNYAKRQQTFWRGFKKQISLQGEGMQDCVFEVDLTTSNIDEYIKQLLSRLK